MEQSKLESLIEVIMNTTIGFIGSLIIGELIIIPFFAPDWSHVDNLRVTIIYTIWAIFRGFMVRRFFNAGLHREAVRIAEWIKRTI